MRVTLQIISGAETGRTVQLRSGQVAQFGRTDWADFSFGDAAMADVHFSVQCGSTTCAVRQVGKEDLFVNGQKVAEANVHQGDQIAAGRTVFVVHTEGAPEETAPPPEAASPTVAPPAATAVPAAPPAPAATTGAGVAKYLELDPDAQKMAKPEETPAELLAKLSAADLFGAAIRLQAHLLSKPQAVWWAWNCVMEIKGEPDTDLDRNALDRAKDWVKDPTEENRRAAEAAAQATEYQTPAGWVAVAAFWSGGSLSAPDLPPVQPDERLTGQAVTGCLMMTAAHGAPPSIEQRYRDLLTTASRVASGELPLPSNEESAVKTV